MSRQDNQISGVSTWSAKDLAAVYTSHSRALVARALGYVQDPLIAEDLVQEAFIKVMLAAPELEDRDHLIAYLNTTVTNLSLNYRRDHGRGPHLVAVDSDSSQHDIAALALQTHSEIDTDLTRAEDAAIVREALSRLTEADRAIILAIDIAEMSVADIAAEYGMKEASVHNAISRARRNLRTILETWIVDEESGLTAAQFLSKTYRKAAENSKKIGAAALSLVLLASAFLGFWNTPTSPANIALPKTTATSPQTGATRSPALPSLSPSTTNAPQGKPTPEALQTWALGYLSKSARLGWPGLDGDDIPLGYTVNDGGQIKGTALINLDPFVMDTTNGSVSTDSRFITFQDGINVILSQKVTNKLGKISYQVSPLARIGGSWFPLEIASQSTDIKQLADGRYLITSFMIVDILKTGENTPISGAGLGNDLQHIPAIIATRLITTSIGTPVIGQAVQVLDPLVGQS